MTISIIGWVLEESEAKLGARLVLLTLAEHAHSDGTKAFPSVATMARQARLSERAVQDALRRLKADGMIVDTGAISNGTRIYTVVGPFNSRGAESAGRGVQNATPRGADSAPEPRTEPKASSSSSSTAGKSPQVVSGKRVTADEHTRTDEIIARFNELSGKHFAGAEWRRKVVGRLREHPELTVQDHFRLMAEQFKEPWWEGDATPAVIYGHGSLFDSIVNGVVRPSRRLPRQKKALAADDPLRAYDPPGWEVMER